MVLMVVGLRQAFYPIKIIWWFMEPTFIDHFSIYIFTILNMNRIMKDPILKINSLTWSALENHQGVIMAIHMSNKRMWFGEMIGLGSRVIGLRTNTNSEKINFGFESRFWFKSWVQIKKFNFTFFSHQWNVTIQKRWSNFKIYRHRNQCWLGIWVQLEQGYQIQHRFKNWNWITKLWVGVTFKFKFNFIEMKTYQFVSRWYWSSSCLCDETDY